jgi:hypothetical protein
MKLVNVHVTSGVVTHWFHISVRDRLFYFDYFSIRVYLVMFMKRRFQHLKRYYVECSY